MHLLDSALGSSMETGYAIYLPFFTPLDILLEAFLPRIVTVGSIFLSDD